MRVERRVPACFRLAHNIMEERVLPQNPQAAWRAHLARVPIRNELTFTPDGLVLGAGTVLVEPQVGRLLKSVKGQEARVLALLSVNPPPNGPTPSGFAYYLLNPSNGEPISYDDCQKATGILFEFKGEQYAWLLTIPAIEKSIAERFLDQSADQLAGSGGRPIVWIFAEEEAALFARSLFNRTDQGRE